MAELKNITPQKLLWIDLEMTGLNPTQDKILEVAAIITDWDFTELAEFETGVKQDQEAYDLLATNPFAIARPAETQQLVEHSKRGQTQEAIEIELINFIKQHHASGEPMLLAGNSIHMDRQFIHTAWPNVEQYLHYRMLDVSAWKVVMIAKYGLEFIKQEKHRALDDIRESIAELQFYLGYINEQKL